MLRLLPFLALGASVAAAEVISKWGAVAVIPPPPAMPPATNPNAQPAPAPRTTLWTIGAPTDVEQYFLELLNRARANPAAEGQRLAATTDPEVTSSYSYFGVNLTKMQQEMSALAVMPPLAMSAKLLQSSRAHSLDQLTNAFQGHQGSNGTQIGNRIAAVGYSASSYAENVYAYSKSTWFCHAGFEVDWGYGSGGMQDGRGHRVNIHGTFRETGIGVYEGTNGSGSGAVGPQVVTQDFATAAGSVTPFVTGVAYYDFNGNAFYDPGEGIGGVTVTVAGSAYHAVTAPSGGYAVPVPSGAASRTVTFTGLGFNTAATATLTASSHNTKVDLKPAYVPPAVVGPASPFVSAGNSYSVTSVSGASGYDWRVMRRTLAATDGANDTTRVNTSLSGYSAVTTGTKQEGTGSYHLAQPAAKNERITYKAVFRGLAAPVLRYQSRLAAATTGQRAFVEVSADSGVSWSTVDSQSGTGGNGQSSFSLRTVPLTAMAGRDFMLRFSFTLAGTSFYTSTNNSTGWFIDAVSFTDILDTTGAVVTGAGTDAAFTFTPADTGTWVLFGRPVISGRTGEFGPAREVAATVAPPPIYSAWASSHESSAGLTAGTIASAAASDYNKDGVTNLMAYALDLSPVAPSSAALPRPVPVAGVLRFDYSRRTDRTDVSLTPQISTNLQTWFSPGQSGAPAGFTDTVQSSSGLVEMRRAAVPIVPGQRYWLRLRAVKL